jgi:hypothetical protein
MTSATQSTPAVIADGDLLVVAVYWGQHTATVQVTDDLRNNWVHLSSQDACSISLVQIWYAEGVSGGSDTITVTQTGTGKLGFYLLEYGGIRLAGSFDAASQRSADGNSNAMQVGPLTTNGPLELVIAVFADTRVSTGLIAAGPGFLAEADDQGFISMVEDDVQAPVEAGSYSPTATLAPGVSDLCWSAAAATFRAR